MKQEGLIQVAIEVYLVWSSLAVHNYFKAVKVVKFTNMGLHIDSKACRLNTRILTLWKWLIWHIWDISIQSKLIYWTHIFRWFKSCEIYIYEIPVYNQKLTDLTPKFQSCESGHIDTIQILYTGQLSKTWTSN